MDKRHRQNNFDFLRFVFASLVVISHSYPLSGSDESQQWIHQVTDGQMNWASLGLNGFFIISGFFIYRSFLRSDHFWIFTKKRLLRLFPALFVVLLLSITLIPFIYESKIPLLLNKDFWTYVPYNLFLYGFQGVIPGVFDSNPYHAINGSLWTIRYEFTLYMCVAFFFIFKSRRLLQIILLVMAFVSVWTLYNYFLPTVSGSSFMGLNGFSGLKLGGFFIVGSLLASLNFDKWKALPLITLVATILLVISIYFHFYSFTTHVLFSFIILGIGFIPLPGIRDFGKYGDPSYGIYIYAFPVQQDLFYFFQLQVVPMIVISLIISIILGYLSWQIVERPALKFKRKPLKKVVTQLY